VKTEDRKLATNYIMGIVNAPPFDSPDYVPFLLAIWELHGILYTEIRTKRHLSYAPSADVHEALMPYADVYVSTSDPKESVSVMCGVLKMLRKFDLANRSLDQIKALYITGKYREEQSTDAIAESLGRAEVLGGWELAEQLPDLIQKVTRAGINDAFNRYVTGIDWVYLGDAGKEQEAEESFGKKIY
jgi:zinc protease